ncbi:phosphatase [Rhodobacter phage RcCWillis]|nr:phosphatase [Rhodobacter phage RcCWillis]
MKRREDFGRTIIFDCDDVLLDWQDGFRSWMLRNHGLVLDQSGPSSWNMDEWVGAPALPFVKQFNSSIAFGDLSAYAGAKRAVSALYASGHNLHVITACSDDPATIRRRELNLDRIFGDVFTSIICVPLGASKADALVNLPTGVWIEDNVDHALTGHKIGHKAFVLRRNHNFARENATCNLSGLHWVDDFEPILREFAWLHDAVSSFASMEAVA